MKPQLNPKIEIGKCYHFNENAWMHEIKVLVTEIDGLEIFGSYLQPKVEKAYLNFMPVVDVSDASSWFEIPIPIEIKKLIPINHRRGLFELMYTEHNLMLTDSEMDDIIHEIKKIKLK